MQDETNRQASRPALVEQLEDRRLMSAAPSAGEPAAPPPSTEPVRAVPLSAPAPKKGTRRYEVAYMEFVADHHFMGTRMAQLGQQKTDNRFFRRMNARIERDQAREIDQMQQYLKDWYGTDYRPGLTAQDQADLAELAALDGPEFDAALSRMFSDHHAAIIAKSREAVRVVYHRVLRDFADHIIPEQGQEINDFDEYLHALGQRRHNHFALD